MLIRRAGDWTSGAEQLDDGLCVRKTPAAGVCLQAIHRQPLDGGQQERCQLVGVAWPNLPGGLGLADQAGHIAVGPCTVVFEQATCFSGDAARGIRVAR